MNTKKIAQQKEYNHINNSSYYSDKNIQYKVPVFNKEFFRGFQMYFPQSGFSHYSLGKFRQTNKQI